jgi:hypothetical protein
MQHAFPTAAVALTRPRRAEANVALSHEEALRVRRLRSLLALFVLYAVALVTVMAVSDGADVGCILAGIAGHVLFATSRLLHVWRDDCWLEDARARTRLRLAPARVPAQAH